MNINENWKNLKVNLDLELKEMRIDHESIVKIKKLEQINNRLYKKRLEKSKKTQNK
jgi:hypothetical protein